MNNDYTPPDLLKWRNHNPLPIRNITVKEIFDNFSAVNQKLKEEGYDYYRTPSSPRLQQIFVNGKLQYYYPDFVNYQYETVKGPKGNLTDIKNANFNEQLLRQLAAAKSPMDQYQDRLSGAIRSEIAKVDDPTKVDLAPVIASVDGSINRDGGRGFGITLSQPTWRNPIGESVRLNHRSVDASTSPEKLDEHAIIAAKNNDIDAIIKFRSIYQKNKSSTTDLGLDRNSDEYQYLALKYNMIKNEKGYTTHFTNTGDKPTRNTQNGTLDNLYGLLAKDWQSFKDQNDELKANGYDYWEIKDEKNFGLTFTKDEEKSFTHYFQRVKGTREGPDSDLEWLYRYTTQPDGSMQFAEPSSQPGNPQFNKDRYELRLRTSQSAGKGNSSDLFSTSWQIRVTERNISELLSLEKRLTAKGVDVEKLAADNPPMSYKTEDGDWATTFGGGEYDTSPIKLSPEEQEKFNSTSYFNSSAYQIQTTEQLRLNASSVVGAQGGVQGVDAQSTVVESAKSTPAESEKEDLGNDIIAEAVAPAMRQIEQTTPSPLPQQVANPIPQGQSATTDQLLDDTDTELSQTGRRTRNNGLHASDRRLSADELKTKLSSSRLAEIRAGGSLNQYRDSIYSTTKPPVFTPDVVKSPRQIPKIP